MNNNQGKPTQRPAQGRPSNAPRPQQNRSGAQRPSANQARPNQTPARPAAQRPMQRKRQRGLSNGTLALILGVLVVVLVALIITLVVIKSDSDGSKDNDNITNNSEAASTPASTPESTPESTPNDSAEVGANPNLPNWKLQISNPKAFVPTTTSSTINLSANQIYSNNIIMVERATGNVVCEYGADTKIYPASMTKIMTVIVACDLIDDMNKTFTFTKELLYSIEKDATNAGFQENTPTPMIDLIYGAILPSGADACLGLANALTESEAAFVELMNKKAAEIGCTNTHFTNSTGLHDTNHYSSVRDIATIMSYAMENPFLREVLTTKRYKTIASITVSDGTLYYKWTPSVSSTKATMIGAKSGYTPEAGRCLASVSKTADGREYVIVSAGAFYTDGMSLDAKSQSYADVKYLCDTYIK